VIFRALHRIAQWLVYCVETTKFWFIWYDEKYKALVYLVVCAEFMSMRLLCM